MESALSEGRSQVQGHPQRKSRWETWRRRCEQGKGDPKWTAGENSTFLSSHYVPGICTYRLIQASSLWVADVVTNPTV